MSSAKPAREAMYRAYMEFFETAESKRRWNPFEDVPWDQIDARQTDEIKARRLEMFCAEELYVPDYGGRGIELARPVFGFAWFQLNWSYEESKHGLVLREYLTRSGLRSEAEIEELEASVFAREWQMPFTEWRQMVCYGALQEAATFHAYRIQKVLAQEAKDAVLEAIFGYLSRDEAAHAGFYRTMIQVELAEDRTRTLADLAHVISNFRMPGADLIPHYYRRLKETGAGITTRQFVERALLSTLRSIGTTRAELRSAASGESILSDLPAA